MSWNDLSRLPATWQSVDSDGGQFSMFPDGRKKVILEGLSLPKHPFEFDFFISYTTREDTLPIRQFVAAFAQLLKDSGYKVLWVDVNEIGTGPKCDGQLRAELRNGIDSSLCVLAFTSPGYWTSDYCLFEFERILLTTPGIRDAASTQLHPFLGVINWRGRFAPLDAYPCHRNDVVAEGMPDYASLLWLWKQEHPFAHIGDISGEHVVAIMRNEQALQSEQNRTVMEPLLRRSLALLAYSKKRRWSRWRQIHLPSLLRRALRGQ